MPRDVAVAVEKAKGHVIYRVVLAMARKKAIEQLDLFLGGLEAKGQISLLAREQVSKTKYLRQYEQVKVLFASAYEEFDVDTAIAARLAHLSFTEKVMVSIGLSTFKETDVWLKWNIKEHTAQFQLRGGQLEIREVKELQPNGATLRICHYSLKSELRLAIYYRDRMLEKKLADPDAITYQFT